jgi:hypothetical protein
VLANALRVFAIVALAGAAFALATGCRDGGDARADGGDARADAAEGHALRTIGYRTRIGPSNPVGVGQEITLMDVPLTNDSRAPVELESVEVILAPGAGDLMEVLSVGVAPRYEDRPPFAPLGFYLRGSPLVGLDSASRCVRQEVVPVAGFRVEPRSEGDASVLVIRLRARAAGMFAMTGQRIRYVQGGRTYEQVQHYVVELAIRAGARLTGGADAECGNRADADTTSG